MIGRAELKLLASQIERAETRLAFQSSIVDKLQFGSDSRYAVLAEDLLFLMEDRVVCLYKTQEKLLAEMTPGAKPGR